MALQDFSGGVGAGSTPTRSRCVTETLNGSHHFTINGYSLAKGMGVGKCIASDTFTAGGYEWAIYFYPDGKNAEDNSLYVSVFIALTSEVTHVRALFELSLVDQSTKAKHKVHSHFDRSLDSGPYTLQYRGIVSSTLARGCYSIPVPEPDLGEHFGALLDSGEGADVTLEVDGEVYQAHKLVLAARSPVFKAQLYRRMRDGYSGNIRIEDIEAPVFKAMLHFIYRDTLPVADELTGWSSALMAQHLLAAADRYGLDRLRVLCESKLCKDLCTDTVATTLALAEQHHASQLKAICIKYTTANLAEVPEGENGDLLVPKEADTEKASVKAVEHGRVSASIFHVPSSTSSGVENGDSLSVAERSVDSKIKQEEPVADQEPSETSVGQEKDLRVVHGGLEVGVKC